jgi:hypothetical protein
MECFLDAIRRYPLIGTRRAKCRSAGGGKSIAFAF